MMRILLTPVLLLGLTVSWVQAQTSGDEPQSGTLPSSSGAVPAMGQDTTPVGVSQFPPLSGLDEASLEPNVAARSFLVFGAQASELLDTNAANSLNGNAPVTGVTHLLGSVGLQRLWERYQMSLGYVGGGALYAGSVRPNSQLHELNFAARTLWRTGQLVLRDTASYFPDGTFGGSFEGIGGGAGVGGLGSEFGGATGQRFNLFGAGGSFGAFGDVPRFNNISVLDLQQSLSPRSAFTLAGGYGLLHFTKATNGVLLDSHQVTGQAGYNYTINRRNKIALIYAYQHFQFPTVANSSFSSNVVHFVYGHNISGRMDLLVGAGPQFTQLSSPASGSNHRISASVRASLRYRFPRTSLRMSYDRYDSVAAGLFAGAETDRATFTVSRPFSRRWIGAAHAGYAHNHRLQSVAAGVNANSYDEGFAGVRVTRILSRSFEAFVFYNFTDLVLDRSFCGAARTCGRNAVRNAIGFGLMWHPHAIRLD